MRLLSEQDVMDPVRIISESLVPKILKVACQKGVPKMYGLLNACAEEEDLDEAEKLSDGQNHVCIHSTALYFMKMVNCKVTSIAKFLA